MGREMGIMVIYAIQVLLLLGRVLHGIRTRPSRMISRRDPAFILTVWLVRGSIVASKATGLLHAEKTTGLVVV